MSETKYAKIINEETKEVQVGVGCPDAYYVEIGMRPMEVELAYNGRWYVAGYAPEMPEPTVDEKKASVRSVRDSYIDGIEWRVSRYRDQVEMGITPNDTEEEYRLILQYIQYLRDYPESAEDWYEQDPKIYDDWKAQQ